MKYGSHLLLILMLIILVIRLVLVGNGSYLVEEPVHGDAGGKTVYGISETRYSVSNQN